MKLIILALLLNTSVSFAECTLSGAQCDPKKEGWKIGKCEETEECDKPEGQKCFKCKPTIRDSSRS